LRFSGTSEDESLTFPEMPLKQSLPMLRVVGQVLKSYIVAEGPDGLYLIDQHAAHERIRFETVKKQRARRAVEVQGLLEPVSFEVTPQQGEILKRHHQELAEFGFTLEPFVPALWTDDGWLNALRELLEALAGDNVSDREEKISITIACHGAILAGQSLNDVEIRELVRNLEQTDNPWTCPHGRPTVIHLSSGKLAHEFGRS
ncbi:DNA mismatch repair protein MutL, partial [Chloroflexota bacterium]